MNRTLIKLLFAFTLSFIAMILTGCGSGEIDGTAATGGSSETPEIGDPTNVEPLAPPPKLEVPQAEF